MEEKAVPDHGWGQDEHGVSHLVYTFPQGVKRIVQGVQRAIERLSGMRPMLIPKPFPIGFRNRAEWCIGEFRIGAEYNEETDQYEGGFVVRIEVRDFGSECPPPINGTWPDRILHVLNVVAPLERLIMLSAYTPEGFYVGSLEDAITVFGRWGLTNVQPWSVAAGGCRFTAISEKTTCSVGFDPENQKWIGWSHRAANGYGIGYVAEEGYPETSSGFCPDWIAEHPEDDVSVPIGFECKTLEDAKRCAIACAESLS